MVEDPQMAEPEAQLSVALDEVRAGLRRGRDQVLMLALDRRVRNLEDVENVHRDLVGQLGNGAGHPDETDLPLVAQRLQRVHGMVGLHPGTARRHVHLNEIEIVGAEPRQALLYTRPDVGGADVVRGEYGPSIRRQG